MTHTSARGGEPKRTASYEMRPSESMFPAQPDGDFHEITAGEAVDEAAPILTFSVGADAAGTCQLGERYDPIGDFDWVLIRENVLDLTHIAHLHAATFRQNDWNTVPEVSQEGDVIQYRQAFGPGPLSPLFCHAMGLGETKPVTREQIGTMASLAVSFSDWHVHDPDPAPGAREDFLMRGCHITTPAMRGKTHYYWGAAFDIPDVPADVAAKTKQSVVAAFDEDKRLLERLQSQTTDDPRGVSYPEINLRADGAGIRVRRVLQRKLAAERGTIER